MVAEYVRSADRQTPLDSHAMDRPTSWRSSCSCLHKMLNREFTRLLGIDLNCLRDREVD